MSSNETKTIVRPKKDDGTDGVPTAIISDIHANLDALEAVLADIRARDIKRVLCLGDVIGYGANPVECWRLVNETCDIIIRGNHDQALGSRDMPRFHPRARRAIEWTRRRMEEEQDGREMIEAIANLPRSAQEGSRLYVHGSPAGPTMDYLLPSDAYDRRRMEQEFAVMDTYAFNGHTHIPGSLEKGGRFMPPEALAHASYKLSGKPVIINVGSVGQPRDGNPHACYLSLIDGVATHHRVAYDAAAACKKILAIPELDPFLGQRLLAGY